MSGLNEYQQALLVALRSGEYKQGRGAIKAVFPDGHAEYCCIGVACDVFGKNPSKDWPTSVPFFGGEVPRDGDNAVIYTASSAEGSASGDPLGWAHRLDPIMMKQFGLTVDDFATMVSMNDGHDWSFEMIATVLEYAWLEETSVAKQAEQLCQRMAREFKYQSERPTLA